MKDLFNEVGDIEGGCIRGAIIEKICSVVLGIKRPRLWRGWIYENDQASMISSSSVIVSKLGSE